MSEDKGKSDDNNAPYVYIHIHPKKTGEKSERLKVPATTLKKFSHDSFLKNEEKYRDKIFTYLKEDGLKYKCVVLQAAESSAALDNAISWSKRICIPKLNFTLNSTIQDSSPNGKIQKTGKKRKNQSDLNDDTRYFSDGDAPSPDKADGKAAKRVRKTTKTKKVINASEISNSILNQYLNNNEDDPDNNIADEEQEPESITPVETSPPSPIADMHFKKAIQAYKNQWCKIAEQAAQHWKKKI